MNSPQQNHDRLAGRRDVVLRGGARRLRGFTLIELILVMALLAVVLAISAPSLGKFFRGRSLESEARQMLSLVHYGQSRAAGEGTPVILWLDATTGQYGLEIDPGFQDETDSKAITHVLPDDLRMEVMPKLRTQSQQTVLKLPVLRFLPDGSLSDQSVPGLALHHTSGDVLWIAQSRTGLTYEIRDEQSMRQASLR